MKKKIIWALNIIGISLLISCRFMRGFWFFLTFAALGVFGLAFIVFLTLPFKNPRVKKAARITLGVIGAMAVAVAISIVAIEITIANHADGNPTDDADIVVVLGAGLNGSTPSEMLASRLDVTADYMKENTECVAILTGGQGDNEDVTEASAMKKYLIDKGIAADRLILEDKSRNTAQNIKFAIGIIDDLGLSGEVMVISSEFHLYRAEKIFERFDIDAYSMPASTPNHSFIPLNSYGREYCSIVVMGIKDILGYDE